MEKQYETLNTRKKQSHVTVNCLTQQTKKEEDQTKKCPPLRSAPNLPRQKVTWNVLLKSWLEEGGPALGSKA